MKKNIKKMVSAVLMAMAIIVSSIGNGSTAYAASSSLAEGLYTLTPACATSCRLDVSGGGTGNKTNLQIYKSNGTVSQQFYIINAGGGYYAIIARVSGKAVVPASKKSGGNVYQYTFSNSTSDLWLIKSAGNGYYYIYSAANTNLALDVSTGGNRSGLNVQVYQKNATAAQKWKLTRVSSSLSGSTVSSVKSTTNSSAATFSVKTNGTSSKVKVVVGYKALSGKYTTSSSSTVTVRIVSGGTVIKSTTMRGASATFSIPSKYKTYTVYVSKYVWKNNKFVVGTIAGGKYSTNLGNYCQISLTNATVTS